MRRRFTCTPWRILNSVGCDSQDRHSLRREGRDREGLSRGTPLPSCGPHPWGQEGGRGQPKSGNLPWTESGAKGRQVSGANSINIALESGKKMQAAVPLTESKEIGVSKLGEF